MRVCYLTVVKISAYDRSVSWERMWWPEQAEPGAELRELPEQLAAWGWRNTNTHRASYWL